MGFWWKVMYAPFFFSTNPASSLRVLFMTLILTRFFSEAKKVFMIELSRDKL